jgi:hypothetical protein
MDLSKYSVLLKLIVALGAVMMIVQCWLIATIVLQHPASYYSGSDYIQSFHVAGWLASHEQASSLYALAGAVSFAGERFDVISHKFLPLLPTDKTFVFMYLPLVAFIFAPLSNLAPNIACFVWQSVSFFALLISSLLIAAIEPAQRSTKTLTLGLTIFLCTFLFIPVFSTLFLGQVDIVLGLLPLTVGSYFWIRRKQSLIAGLIFALTFLKLQFVPAVVLIGVACALRRDYKVLLGLIVGLLSILSITLALTGPEVLSVWWGSLGLSERMFMGGLTRNPDHLVASLPLAITIAFPVEQRAALTDLVHAVEGIFFFFTLFVLWMLSKSKLDSTTWKRQVLLFSIVPLATFSPRLLTYDWVIFILPFALTLLACGSTNRKQLAGVLALALVSNLEILTQLALGIAFPVAFIAVSTTILAFLQYDAVISARRLPIGD